MKDFSYDDVIPEIRSKIGIRLPKALIRYILRFALKKIIDVVKHKKGKFNFYQSSIKQIYYNIDERPYSLELMDMDETKGVTWHQERLLKEVKNYGEKRVGFKRIGRRNKNKRVQDT